MENRFAIRRGSTVPEVNLSANPPVKDLEEYELGWALDTKRLYIYNPDQNAANNIELVAPIYYLGTLQAGEELPEAAGYPKGSILIIDN